jgi:hypothetical protein
MIDLEGPSLSMLHLCIPLFIGWKRSDSLKVDGLRKQASAGDDTTG